MSKRYITVPKNALAERLLDTDEASAEQLLEIELQHQDFIVLCKEGLFSLINDTAGCNIDDAEDDSVTNRTNIQKLLKEITEQNNRPGKFSNQPLLHEILRLFREAETRGTGVYFFF